MSEDTPRLGDELGTLSLQACGNCRGHKILQIVTSTVRVMSTTTRVTSVDDLTYLYKPHQLRYRENIAR